MLMPLSNYQPVNVFAEFRENPNELKTVSQRIWRKGARRKKRYRRHDSPLHLCSRGFSKTDARGCELNKGTIQILGNYVIIING